MNKQAQEYLRYFYQEAYKFDESTGIMAYYDHQEYNGNWVMFVRRNDNRRSYIECEGPKEAYSIMHSINMGIAFANNRF